MHKIRKDLSKNDYEYNQKELGLGELIRNANYAIN